MLEKLYRGWIAAHTHGRLDLCELIEVELLRMTNDAANPDMAARAEVMLDKIDQLS